MKRNGSYFLVCLFVRDFKLSVLTQAKVENKDVMLLVQGGVSNFEIGDCEGRYREERQGN